jgi:hypothetical protein
MAEIEKKYLNKIEKLENKRALSFLSPAFLFLILFMAYPVFYSFYLSFFKWNGAAEKIFIGFSNYKRIFQDSIFWKSLTNNISLSLLTVIFQVFLALIIAYENALKLAKYLENHPKVEKVSYPGLESHPNHELAKEILPKFGSMINFKVKDEESGVEFLNALKLCCFAGSLGGVRTTLQPPATCAFLDIPEKERNEMGIYLGMIRVSTGIEDIEDIICDFEQAFDKI